ncbi:MAG: hypothetical protein HQL37_00305 [Alphaproteobacteria bacterium]|nr:hypothetical protein [Alphaproteobacteria bacterium]
MRAKAAEIGLLMSLMVLQFGLWWQDRGLMPQLSLLDEPPSREMAAVASLGDLQYYFRSAMLDLQEAGDTGGRMTPLKDYDYVRVGRWLRFVNSLDRRSEHPAALAAGYFGATQNPAMLPPIVDFLADYGEQDPSRNWIWMVKSFDLAKHRMKDLSLALTVAERLSAISATHTDIPDWPQILPAYTLFEMGRRAESGQRLHSVLAKAKNLDNNELMGIHSVLGKIQKTQRETGSE